MAPAATIFAEPRQPLANGHAHELAPPSKQAPAAQGVKTKVLYTRRPAPGEEYSFKIHPDSAPGKNKFNVPREESEVFVNDIRQARHSFSLQEHGFQLERLVVPEGVDWTSDQSVGAPLASVDATIGYIISRNSLLLMAAAGTPMVRVAENWKESMLVPSPLRPSHAALLRCALQCIFWQRHWVYKSFSKPSLDKHYLESPQVLFTVCVGTERGAVLPSCRGASEACHWRVKGAHIRQYRTAGQARVCYALCITPALLAL